MNSGIIEKIENWKSKNPCATMIRKKDTFKLLSSESTRRLPVIFGPVLEWMADSSSTMVAVIQSGGKLALGRP